MTNSFVDEDEDEDEFSEVDEDHETEDDDSDDDKQTNKDDEDDDVEDDDEDTDFVILDEVAAFTTTNDRRNTSPYLTKYELSKLIAIRSQQIQRGAKIFVEKRDFLDGKFPVESYGIAIKELRMKRIPLIIRRNLPNGEKIQISVNDLKIPNHIIFS